MANWIKVVMLAAALAIPAPALAQAFDPGGRSGFNERRVSVGLAIPLGGSSRAEAGPQLELRSSAGGTPGAQYRALHGDGLIARRNRDARVGLTLEAQPRFTIAGREQETSEHRLGISTIGLVAIGVAAAAVVGGLLFVDAVNDSSD